MINALFARYLHLNILISFGTIFTSVGYLIFAFSSDFIWTAIGFLTLTFALSFVNTGFLTFYQNNALVKMMGRLSSILDVAEALEALFITITAATGVFAELFEIRKTIYCGATSLFDTGDSP